MKRYLWVLVLLAGCCHLPKTYVEQDRRDFDSFAPRINKMIDETKLYDEDQKQDMRDRLTARNLRIKKAEAMYAD